MNATSKLVYPGPTVTHRFPSIATRSGDRYGTLLGWAETPEVADVAARDFLASAPVSFDDMQECRPKET